MGATFQEVDFTLPARGKLTAAESIGQQCGRLWFGINREHLPSEVPAEVRAWSSQVQHAWRKGLASAWHEAREQTWASAFPSWPAESPVEGRSAKTTAERQRAFRASSKASGKRRLEIVLPAEASEQFDALVRAEKTTKATLFARLIAQEWARTSGR